MSTIIRTNAEHDARALDIFIGNKAITDPKLRNKTCPNTRFN